MERHSGEIAQDGSGTFQGVPIASRTPTMK